MTRDLMRSDGSSRTRPNGFSLVECLVVVALLGILATLAIPSSSAVQRRLDLDSGLRRLRVGLDRGRMAAERDRQPCSLQLTASGWQPPPTGDLPACQGAVMSLVEIGAGEVELRSNLPDAVRFSTNGLVLDGGLVVLALEWNSNSCSSRAGSLCRPRMALSQSAMLWRANCWSLASRWR